MSGTYRPPGSYPDVVAFLKRLRGRDEAAVAAPAQVAAAPGPSGQAAYERLLAAALVLRDLGRDLAAAAGSIGEREERLRHSVEEYDRIAQAAIAGGRSIQAESAIASSEAAQAALDALAPQAADLAALRAQADATAARIEADAAALRARLDNGAPAGDLAQSVSRAEDEAVRLTSLVRSYSF